MKLNFHPLSILLGLSLILSPVLHSKSDVKVEKLPTYEMTTQLVGSGLNAAEALTAAGLAPWEKPPLAWSCKTTKGSGFSINQKIINGGIVMIEWDPNNANNGVEVFNVASGADLNESYDFAGGVEMEVKIYACTNEISYISAIDQGLTELHVENLNELETLFVHTNNISNAQDLRNCTKLKDCLFSYQANANKGNQLPELRVEGLQNLERLHATSRVPSSGHISHSMDLRASSQLTEVYLDNHQIPSIFLNGLSNLIRVYVSKNQLNGTVDLRGCSSLNYVAMEDNFIDNLLFDPKDPNPNATQAHENLDMLWMRRNELKGNIDLKACTNLRRLYISAPNDSYYNQLSSIDIQDLTNLQDLYVYGNNLNYDIDLTSNIGLVRVELSQNSLTGLNINSLANMTEVRASRNQINGTVDFGGCTAINYIEIEDNLIDNLVFDPPVPGANSTQPHESLDMLWARRNEISNALDLRGCKNLRRCFITHPNDATTPKNNVPAIDVRGLANLVDLYVTRNAISSPVNLAGCTNLKNCHLADNQIPSIQFLDPSDPGLLAPANIDKLWIGYNNFTSLNFTDLNSAPSQNIKHIYGEYNGSLTNVTLAGLSSLETIYFPYCDLDNSAIATLTDEVWNFGVGQAAANSRGSFHVFFNPGSYNLFDETKEKIKCGFGGTCPGGTQACDYSLYGAGWSIGYLTINCP